jgi:hypothetical protein
MQNTFKIYENLRQTFGDEPARVLTVTIGQVYEDLANVVTKVEFNELKEVVRELAEAQKRTELKVEELAEAQKRTELKVEELAEAQKRTELKVEELAEAQKRTEETVRQLVTGIDDVKKQLGGLSADVGYGLEDRYLPLMKPFVLHQYGAQLPTTAQRKFILYPNGKRDEVNFYLEGELKGEKVYFIGEAKTKPGKKDVEQFNAVLKRLKVHFNAEVKGFMVGYLFPPEVEDYVKEEYPEIDLFKTYEIEEIARKAS